MSHYVEYWRPERAALAFDGNNSPVVKLCSSWFGKLNGGDVVWLLTRDGEQVVLITRFEVANVSRYTPYYAKTKIDAAHAPRAIPIAIRTLRRLRFDSPRNRVVESGTRIFEHDLATMRRLSSETHLVLEQLWEKQSENRWNQVQNRISANGFFASPEVRAEVELAAVRAVTAWHTSRGWEVRSREDEGVGYDLECTKGNQRRAVEVKGTAGDGDTFIITRGEKNRAEADPDFFLAVVHHATKSPAIKFVQGKHIDDVYHFEPLAFTAVSKARIE